VFALRWSSLKARRKTRKKKEEEGRRRNKKEQDGRRRKKKEEEGEREGRRNKKEERGGVAPFVKSRDLRHPQAGGEICKRTCQKMCQTERHFNAT